MVETGPRQVGLETNPESLEIKIRKMVQWRKSRRARLGGLSRWSKWSRNNNQKWVKVARAQVERKPRGKDGSMYNAAIVAKIISCVIARNRRKSRRRSVPPQEKISLSLFTHTDRSPRWNP